MSLPITPPPVATTFSLPLTSKKKTPRLDAYGKLLHRFCEVLFLLKGLGPIRGPHTRVPPPRNEAHGRQRDFFRNLALVCDGQKGGSTVTAIGLAKKDGKLCIYAAANDDSTAIDFLRLCVRFFSKFMAADVQRQHTLQRMFIEMCVQHATPRIQSYTTNLRNCLDACIDGILAMKDVQYLPLVPWLRSIQTNCRGGVKPLATCIAMHKATQQGLWNQLCALADATLDKTSHFPRAKHNIGRLSSRIRAPHAMLASLQDFSGEFSALRVHIAVIAVPPMAAAKWPEPDSHTSLDGILGRMVGANFPRMDEVKARLLFLDMVYDREPLQAILLHYTESEPFVHAEIRVLEHLDTLEVEFFNNDRYIYTSKPACYCCRLYFEKFSKGIIVPESHFKIPKHWGFPKVEEFSKYDAASIEQRDLINGMNKVMRTEILQQIDGITIPAGWQTDSTTGVPSIVSLDTVSVFSDDLSPRFELGTYGTSIQLTEEFDDGQLTPRPLTPGP
ncbi:hypothetical protein VHEMI01928 [[Torrubiella] hemipterigena]|uniref:Uncharacterized protein n=1 Tax=[Torrubiella] hemipterigena TaxID=1531966 RepID=A0A0A1SN68_9HYPO|nr:hypothetical protein VHEMI01928 [[Torrubiella] hemipterigena]